MKLQALEHRSLDAPDLAVDDVLVKYLNEAAEIVGYNDMSSLANENGIN